MRSNSDKLSDSSETIYSSVVLEITEDMERFMICPSRYCSIIAMENSVDVKTNYGLLSLQIHVGPSDEVSFISLLE